mmetsp:Transcript_33592/g.96366  ORF Transcript_33592/g.96366 Transcript_33592/m.96366 type:complete len:201 (-) Transcript_33592:1039-1641(-)
MQCRGCQQGVVADLRGELDGLLGRAEDLVPAPALQESLRGAVETTPALDQHKCANLHHQHQQPHFPRELPGRPDQCPRTLCSCQSLWVLLSRHVYSGNEVHATRLATGISKFAQQGLSIGSQGECLAEVPPRGMNTRRGHGSSGSPGVRVAAQACRKLGQSLLRPSYIFSRELCCSCNLPSQGFVLSSGSCADSCSLRTL